MDRTTSSRRRFLALTAAGGGLSTAGCSGLLGDTPAQNGGSADGDGTRQVMVLVTPDQEAMMEERSRIGEEIQSGNLSQREVQDMFAAAQQRVLAETAGEVESVVTERGMTVEAVKPRRGALLVSGSAVALLDLLSHESVRGLLSEASFQELQTPTPTSTPNSTDG